MKVTLDCKESNEEEIVIRCKKMDETILKLVALANSTGKKLVGTIEKQVFILEPEEAYYFESVDDKVFIYTAGQVYECALRLYEIERDFAGRSYLRANKSTILNLAKVKSLNPLLNGRIEATLENGEKLIISRQYAPVLKHKLGI